MRLDDFSDELWLALAEVPGLNIPADGPGVHAGPPAPAHELPEVEYGAHGGGLNRVRLGLLVAFGPPNNPEVFRSALEYASDEGTRSIPAALLAYEWTTVHTVWVARAEPMMDTINGHPQLAYEFTLDVSGAPQ